MPRVLLDRDGYLASLGAAEYDIPDELACRLHPTAAGCEGFVRRRRARQTKKLAIAGVALAAVAYLPRMAGVKTTNNPNNLGLGLLGAALLGAAIVFRRPD